MILRRRFRLRRLPFFVCMSFAVRLCDLMHVSMERRDPRFQVLYLRFKFTTKKTLLK